MTITEKVVAALRRHPEGVTSEQLGGELGLKPVQVGTPLSRLAAYGKVDRELCRHTDGRSGPHKFYIWKPKAESHHA